MVDDPKWPAYPIGNRQSIFALGIASIKYAELESVFTLIFALATEIPSRSATMIEANAAPAPVFS